MTLLLRGVKCFRIPSKITSEISARSLALPSGNQIEEPNNDHLFKKIWTKHELVDHLTSNIYYEDDNYIVVRKPYGVRARINRTKQLVSQDEGMACESAVTDILPDLAAAFNAPKLDLVMHPQWLFSGVTIFTKCTSSNWDVLRDFESINKFNSVYSYLAVVMGDPPETFEGSFRIASNSEIVQLQKKMKHSSLLVYEHKKLGSSNGASLLKIDLNYNYMKTLRLILSTKCFTPVLGDFAFSSRMTTLFGVPLLIPPEQVTVKKTLPPNVLQLLRLNPEDVDCCPLHLHLYSTFFRVRNRVFVTAVPPPDYFLWSCEQLGLKEVSRFLRGFDRSEERAECGAVQC